MEYEGPGGVCDFRFGKVNFPVGLLYFSKIRIQCNSPVILQVIYLKLKRVFFLVFILNRRQALIFLHGYLANPNEM